MRSYLLLVFFLYFSAAQADLQVKPLTRKELVDDVSISVKSFLKLGQKYYFIEDKAKVNWFEAAHLCRQKGSQLASVESREEMEQLDTYMRKQGYTKDDFFWTSGNDLAATKKFEWLGTGNRFQYTFWSKGQPDFPDQEHCVHLWFREDAFKWNNWKCASKAHYICEISPSVALVSYW